MTTNSIVPVPLGGGINEGPHEWLLRPPQAAEVQNFDLDSDGAYVKRSGFETVAALTSDAGTILLPQPNALGVMGSAGVSVLANGSLAAQEFGAGLPTKVDARRVLAFRGAVSGAQIAYNGGYVGLALTEADEEAGRRAIVMILDATTWTIVAGPYELDKLAHGVRVEPIGTNSFLFLGVDIPSTVRTSETIVGTLYSALLAPGGSEPTQRVRANDIKCFNNHALNVLYDSHGRAGQSVVYVSYIADAQGSTRLIAASLDGTTGSSSNVRVVASGCNHSIWYDNTSNTVLVYNTATGVIDYNTGTFSTTWAATAAVATLGELPMFHQRRVSGSDRLWLNNYQINIAGSAPGIPGYSASDGLAPTLHRRPQPRDAGGAFMFHRYTATELENYGDRLLAGGEQVTAVESATLVDGSVAKSERHVVPLSRGRSDLWYMDHFHAYYWFDDPNTERVVAGVTGQSAKNGDVLLVPSLVANSAYLAPPFQRAYDIRDRHPALSSTPTDSSISGGDFASSNQANFGRAFVSDGAGGFLRTNDIAHRTGGSNVNEGVLQLVVEEIDTDPTEASVVDLFGSVLVAAGGLTVFDGASSLPAVLEPPVYVDLDNDSAQPAVYQTATPSSDASEGFTIDANQSVSFRGVLFYIDRNGVKYRSDSFTMGFIENSSGGSGVYFPKWTLTLAQSHKNLVFAGRRLGIEVYASTEYAVASPPSAEPSSHTLAMRAAVTYDPTSGTYEVSGATLYDLDDASTPFSLFTFNPTSLYTETELGPQLPPASNVMAHAGNYLFLLSSEDPWLIWHSKPISASIGPEFHSTLTLRMPMESGGCVSLAGEADRLLFLCRNGVYELFVAGSGPDAEGTGSFPPLRKVYAGDGCVNHACTVSGPFGTFFVAESGPKVVGRDGAIADVGRALDASPSGFLHASYNQLTEEIWVSRGSDGYILDTRTMQWTYTTWSSLAAAVWNRSLYRVNDSYVLMKASSSAVQDGSTSYQAKYVSPWLVLTGAMGYARVRKVAVLIQPITSGNGQIRISLAYDYVDSNVDTFTYDFSTATAFAKPIQVWVRPTRQKLDSLRITVEDIGEA